VDDLLGVVKELSVGFRIFVDGIVDRWWMILAVEWDAAD
jgi:hypothetical protein